MSAPRCFEHAVLRVGDLGRALDFYVGLMGLREIDRREGVVYLGTGFDGNFDVGLAEGGGSGLDHFALRVDDADALDAIASRLAARGVAIERRTDAEPNERAAVRLTLPEGHTMEFVTVADQRYLEPYAPVLDPSGAASFLLDADHVTIAAQDVRATAEYLREVVGLRPSDIVCPTPERWFAAWLRHGPLHHDTAVIAGGPGETLHHFAFTCTGMEDMKRALDRLAAGGVETEIGIGRHPVGANLYAYFWSPCGNRIELSAEMAGCDPSTPARRWERPEDTFDAWGPRIVPESMRRGS